MFKLLTLIIGLFLLSTSVIAAEGNVGWSVLFTEQEGAVDVFRLNNNQRAQSLLSRVNLQLPTIKNHWTLGMSFDIAKKDYSSFLLRNENGVETPLSDTFDGRESTGSVALSYQKGPHSVAALVASSLSESPFFSVGASIAYNHIFLNKKRILGGKFIYSKKDQPSSTYIDPRTLENKTRSPELNSFRYEFSWNEAFSQRWRMNTILFYGTRREDRPDHYGVELRNGLGISDTLTARLHTGALNEMRTGLKDDRGYFRILWVESSLYYELNYDYSVELSYGLTMEKEDFDNGQEANVGTDSYGIKLNYEGSNSVISGSYIYRATNTNYQSHTLQGGITWSI